MAHSTETPLKYLEFPPKGTLGQAGQEDGDGTLSQAAVVPGAYSLHALPENLSKGHSGGLHWPRPARDTWQCTQPVCYPLYVLSKNVSTSPAEWVTSL